MGYSWTLAPSSVFYGNSHTALAPRVMHTRNLLNFSPGSTASVVNCQERFLGDEKTTMGTHGRLLRRFLRSCALAPC